MNRLALSLVALILLLLSAFNNTTMARTLLREGVPARLKIDVPGSVSPPGRKKSPKPPGPGQQHH
ncbi:unnamed protein product [Brassica oleracea]|uniref:Uncharacterized protein n=1 Tax=Brassica oleracea TaxID=3712 RepID=A0A3P6FSX9_BRAOL|nr:unnamed protein product [Brassica oleracea]